jgi:hypothetical protein
LTTPNGIAPASSEPPVGPGYIDRLNNGSNGEKLPPGWKVLDWPNAQGHLVATTKDVFRASEVRDILGVAAYEDVMLAQELRVELEQAALAARRSAPPPPGQDPPAPKERRKRITRRDGDYPDLPGWLVVCHCAACGDVLKAKRQPKPVTAYHSRRARSLCVPTYLGGRPYCPQCAREKANSDGPPADVPGRTPPVARATRAGPLGDDPPAGPGGAVPPPQPPD